MVESVTLEALAHYNEKLQAEGLLDPLLASEMNRFAAESEKLSNWTDSGRHLPSAGYSRLEATGPVTKVLRTLAFLVERLYEGAGALQERGAQVTRVHLTSAYSGCSNFGGMIEVQAVEQGGAEIVLFEGPFVWDCAAHGLPQTRAAQELGYRCMVSFPEIPAVTEARV
jgi:hypothetical protein